MLLESFLFLGTKAKAIINQSRENVARMVGGKAEDIIFTSGGTEVIITVSLWIHEATWCRHAAVTHSKLLFLQANNLVLQTAVKYFWRNYKAAEQSDRRQKVLPHIITSNVEHDSIKLAAEHLQKDGKAGRTTFQEDMVQTDTRRKTWFILATNPK